MGHIDTKLFHASHDLPKEKEKASIIIDLDSSPNPGQISAEVVEVGDKMLEGVAQGVATVFVQVLALRQNKHQFRHKNRK